MTARLRPGVTPDPELGQLLPDAKFSVPALRPGVVSRVKLIEAARSSGRRVIGVTAPAGYGKSAFLTEWAQGEGRRVAWVSLDRFDDDPAMLLVSLASAYVRADPGGADLVAGMRDPAMPVLTRAAARLASALRVSRVPFVLMLDDLHQLRSPAGHHVLSVVTSAIPAGSQLVTASRSEQPHLPRLRALGEALEFGPGDLALNAAGARQIFANAQVSLAPEQAAAVTERTEGWPAGLYLAAVTAKEGNCQPPAVTGEDRYVADYLYREALLQQPEDMQQFLRRTALLDQLCGPLCDALLGSCGAAQYLRRLEASSLFLIPLDGQRHWYRYHALFREFLLGELRRTEPGIIATLHQRAADWHEANGSPALAVEHLLHTSDWDRTLPLVTRMCQPTYQVGQLSTVLRWLSAIGDANIDRYPPLAVLAAWLSLLTGNTIHAERFTAIAEAASFELPMPDGSTSFDSARAMLRVAMCAHGPEAMLADATFAVAHEPPWSPWGHTALDGLAAAHVLAGDLDAARIHFAAATRAGIEGNYPEPVIHSESQLAWLAIDRGDWQQAAQHLDLALATIEKSRMQDYVISLSAFAGAARLAAHHHDPDEAHRQLARAMRERPSATYVFPFVSVPLRLQLANTYLALADMVTARQLLREIDDIFVYRPALGTLTGQAEALRRILASSTATTAPGSWPLTPAELRVLPYLQTHLTAGGIAERLFVSGNTVKSQMMSIYRKLDVSSRDDAVQKATAIGLLGAYRA
jgi:LuxR family transcriptional regulator, maltose regulon positive regulatory protein